jgi:hypothetical protein
MSHPPLTSEHGIWKGEGSKGAGAELIRTLLRPESCDKAGIKIVSSAESIRHFPEPFCCGFRI